MYQASTTPCPKCGAQNLRGSWVCSQCGNTLIVYCPACRASNEAGSQYCHNCHTPLSPQAPQQEQQPYPGYDQCQQQYQQYPQQGYGQPGQQPPYPGYGQQPYPDYDPYQQYPGGYDPYGVYPPPPADWLGRAQQSFDKAVAKLKQIVVTTNPILLSALVVLVVGMTVFTILAFQLGWIKTDSTVKKTPVVADSTPVMFFNVHAIPGSIPHSAIITWNTDKPTGSQVYYGILPYANTQTPIENDPSTGANMGVMSHQVGLTNLLPKTAYVYIVVSRDKNGKDWKGPEMRFDTTP